MEQLEGKKVYLIPLSMQELRGGNYIDWLNDKEVCKYNSHGDVKYTYEDAVTYINELSNNASKIVYAVYSRNDKVHIGNISLQKIDKKNRNAEVALLFGEIFYWNKGCATEALQLLIEKGKKIGLHRLYFGTHMENVAMQKVGEKLNFQKEGLLIEAQFKNGIYNHVYIYGLII
ncbi:MAG: GNAT family N-acetyltransferase [Holosporales bacterium]|jgi:RimJ/RimL family protein N-acetyltransferase|nr:GNAT family N-acetyltransferase [Holosporales bacterium]